VTAVRKAAIGKLDRPTDLRIGIQCRSPREIRDYARAGMEEKSKALPRAGGRDLHRKGRRCGVTAGSAGPEPLAAGVSRREARSYPERPIVGVLAAVMRGDRVLVVRRANPPMLGRWGFPGGVLELGETVAQGAMRELAEETGGQGRSGRAVDGYRHDRPRKGRPGALPLHPGRRDWHLAVRPRAPPATTPTKSPG
jgi:hypothetical protein